MAKGSGKLTKLKSVLKKWNSFGANNSKQCRGGATVNAVPSDDSSASGQHLRPVYVGKTWRRYLVSSDVAEHPLFRELVDRSRESHEDQNDVVLEEEDETVHVACEVVLFEHLLWMLENADPQPESLDDLVDFYAC